MLIYFDKNPILRNIFCFKDLFWLLYNFFNENDVAFLDIQEKVF